MRNYNLFDELFDLRSTVDRFFEDVPSQVRWREYPYINIYEGNDDLEIRAIMPGVRADSLNVQLAGDSLLIEGDKAGDYTENPYLRRERLFGKFNKSIKLPYAADPKSIQAEMKNGILTISLARSEDTKPKRIEIR